MMHSIATAPRTFNTITVDSSTGVVHKSSQDRQRLRDEYAWYAALPPDVRDLVPAVRGWHDTGVTARLTLSLVQLPDLATLFVDKAVCEHSWHRIMHKVFSVHDRLHALRPSPVTSDMVLDMYVHKTFHRLDLLAASSPSWRSLLGLETIRLNGMDLDGLPKLRKGVTARARELAGRTQGSLIHGDFCFSNILYDVTDTDLWLIDPRGRFGRKGTAGDPRYDIAKLRHSVAGGYEFIVRNRYILEVDGGEFTAEVHSDSGDLTDALTGMIDTLAAERGYELRDIRFIEALLFLSMPSLHTEDQRRQLMMYLTGLYLANQELS